MVSKGQIVGVDWNRIVRLHGHVLAHMNSLTASRCHIKASHMKSLTASRRHSARLLVSSYEPARGCVAARCGSSHGGLLLELFLPFSRNLEF